MSTKAEKFILKEAKERFEVATSAWSQFFKKSREVLHFVNGSQWDHQMKNDREMSGLPTLTTNLLEPFIRQITNEARQNCPAIQIDPKDDDANADTAEIIADLIRGIEQHSDASTAYDNASWYAAATGLGFFRVISEYESENSFNQKLVITQIDDPETVLLDPNHKKIDGSDSEYAFILSVMTKDEYKRNFAESKLAKDAETVGWTTEENQWIREDEVVIAEYYYKDYVAKTLYQIFDSSTGETYESTDKPQQELVDADVLYIVNQRPTQEIVIRWAKLNDVEVLEETVWPGKFIPVIPVKGSEIWVAGKREIKGAVYDAMDSQRAFNYFLSTAAQLVSLAPKAPYIGEIRQFSDYEHLWRDANVSTSAYLPYNAVSEGGQMLPPPMRQTSEVPIQAAMSLCNQAHENIKAVFGIFDASQGQSGNETSGKAILARTAQSHTTTYHFYDNLVKAIAQCGLILVEAIPTFYADERTVQLIKRNGESSTSKIGGDSERDLTNGSYGVVVETGPSYATRRQDSVSHMITLGTAYPQSMPLIADLIADEADWPGAKRIASRLRTMLPPAIQQEEAASNKGVDAKQQLAQMSQQFQQMTQQMQVLQQQHQQADGLLHAAMAENKLLKEKSQLDLMKASNENEIKRDQLKLDEAEMELSFKIKLKELAMQERSMKIEEAKLAIDATEVMNDMAGNMHDRTADHHERMLKVSMANPVSGDIGAGGPEGLDKSFETLSGTDVGNA